MFQELAISNIEEQLWEQSILPITLESTFLICRAQSFPRQNLTNSAANLVNFAAHRGKADEIPWLTAVTQLNFRGLIKS